MQTDERRMNVSSHSGSPVQIAFPKEDTGSSDLVIPNAPLTPANTTLATVATRVETRKTLSCKALLVGETLARAELDATKLYEEMKPPSGNSQVFYTYGTAALESVNDLIDRILHEIEPTKIPELTELMRGLNKEMRGIRHKYDLSDPDVAKSYEKGRGWFSRMWGRGHTMLEMLLEDISSIEKNLDRVESQLSKQQEKLLRNVGWYDQIYLENEAEIGKLIYAIGVMELIRDLAASEAASVEVGDASLGDRGGERQAAIAEFANNMEVKIAEYKGRLFVAWATSPQVRMMRTLNIGLAEKLNELVNVVIPTMKGTIAQWQLLMQSKDAAQMATTVAEASNEWLQAYSGAAAAAVPMIAEAIQYPSLTPETVGVMAASIASQADSIIAAMDEGNERRKNLDSAILEAHDVLSASSGRVSDAIIDRIVASATKPLQIEEAGPAI